MAILLICAFFTSGGVCLFPLNILSLTRFRFEYCHSRRQSEERSGTNSRLSQFSTHLVVFPWLCSGFECLCSICCCFLFVRSKILGPMCWIRSTLKTVSVNLVRTFFSICQCLREREREKIESQRRCSWFEELVSLFAVLQVLILDLSYPLHHLLKAYTTVPWIWAKKDCISYLERRIIHRTWSQPKLGQQSTVAAGAKPSLHATMHGHNCITFSPVSHSHVLYHLFCSWLWITWYLSVLLKHKRLILGNTLMSFRHAIRWCHWHPSPYVIIFWLRNLIHNTSHVLLVSERLSPCFVCLYYVLLG